MSREIDLEDINCGFIPRLLDIMFDVKKAIIKVQGGKEYLPVASRLVWFREEHTDWAIVTEPVAIDIEKGYAIFKATVMDAEGKPIGSGTKMETARGFADFVEKAETGAIGRALAVCGYGTQFAPELEEGERIVDSPQPVGKPIYAESGSKSGQSSKYQCSGENCGKDITKGQYEYSQKTFGQPLCPSCQRQLSGSSKQFLSLGDQEASE
jgi:hypothetical protein